MIIAKVPEASVDITDEERENILQGSAYSKAVIAVRATKNLWLNNESHTTKAAFIASMLHLGYMHAVLEQYGAPEMWVDSDDDIEIINDAPFVVIHNDGRDTIPDYQGSPTELLGIDINGDITTTERS